MVLIMRFSCCVYIRIILFFIGNLYRIRDMVFVLKGKKWLSIWRIVIFPNCAYIMQVILVFFNLHYHYKLQIQYWFNLMLYLFQEDCKQPEVGFGEIFLLYLPVICWNSFSFARTSPLIFDSDWLSLTVWPIIK